MSEEHGPERLEPPPHRALHERLLAFADELTQAGHGAEAQALRALLEEGFAEQEAWIEQLTNVLRIHHDINNALVGVRGNTQLLLMAPVAEQAGVKERLEVVLRESTRIKDASSRISELKSSISGPGTQARAA